MEGGRSGRSGERERGRDEEWLSETDTGKENEGGRREPTLRGTELRCALKI